MCRNSFTLVCPKLIFIALFAWALILLVNFITGRVIKVAEHRDALGVMRGAQLRTLASVIRATGIVIVALLAFLQIMENVLHFNLGPLLASAGVAGVAIGLAAQTIVKDVLNGILILIEDQYNVGDVVTLAGMTGTVDTMTLRHTTLRGFGGHPPTSFPTARIHQCGQPKPRSVVWRRVMVSTVPVMPARVTTSPTLY